MKGNIKISYAYSRYSVINYWLYTLNLTTEESITTKPSEKIVCKRHNALLKVWLQKVVHTYCFRNEYYPHIKNLIHQTKFTLSIRHKSTFYTRKWGSHSICYHYELCFTKKKGLHYPFQTNVQMNKLSITIWQMFFCPKRYNKMNH